VSEVYRIIVIIPAYNEEKNISAIIAEIKEFSSSIDIVVVDDGSSDDTFKIANASDVKVLKLPINLGIGGAIQTGMKYAAEHGYDVAIQVDADGQHIPAEIDKLLNAIQKGYDVVIGSRFLRNYNYRAGFARRVAIWLISAINSIIIHQKITDSTSGFRAFNKSTILFVSKVYPVDYPEPEIITILGRCGYKLNEVPVRMRQRKFGKSSINFFDSIFFMLKVVLAILIDIFKEFKC